MAKNHWILPTHSNDTSKVGLTLAGPPCCIDSVNLSPSTMEIISRLWLVVMWLEHVSTAPRGSHRYGLRCHARNVNAALRDANWLTGGLLRILILTMMSHKLLLFSCCDCCDIEVFTARRYASAVLAVVVCPTVCPSVTRRYCIKTAKGRIMQTTPHDSTGNLVFWCQSSQRNSIGSSTTVRRMKVG